MEEGDFPEEASDALRKRWSSYGPRHLPLRLLQLAKMLDRLTSTTFLREHQLTLAEWRVLANLVRMGESTVNVIAAEVLVDRAEVSRASHSLEEQGLIARSSHPTSKAKRLLKPTEQGRALAERIAVGRRKFFFYLLEGLSDEEVAQFDEFLLHIAIRIEQYDLETGGEQTASPPASTNGRAGMWAGAGTSKDR
jgi:DNA-binding MarR family transcriptional regulator